MEGHSATSNEARPGDSGQAPTAPGESSSGRRGGTPGALLESLRAPHWVKNLFVLAALPFSGKWTEGAAWAMALGAFAGFCLLSSAIYLINDIADRRSDRAHPSKAARPIASGRLSVSAAAAAAAVLLALGAGFIALVSILVVRGILPHEPVLPMHGFALPVWAGAYVLLNIAYSMGLKSRPILDVLIVALGFVLRAMAGASAIAVPVSPWLVVCTFTLCLFIALAKRRSEIAALGAAAEQTRAANRFYTLTNIEHMLAVSAGLAVVTYCLYCLAPLTVQRVGSAHLIWTIPLVVYGMFRYYCLALGAAGEDPVRMLMRDRVIWIVGLLWLLCVMVVLKWGGDKPLCDLLLH